MTPPICPYPCLYYMDRCSKYLAPSLPNICVQGSTRFHDRLLNLLYVEQRPTSMAIRMLSICSTVKNGYPISVLFPVAHLLGTKIVAIITIYIYAKLGDMMPQLALPWRKDHGCPRECPVILVTLVSSKADCPFIAPLQVIKGNQCLPFLLKVIPSHPYRLHRKYEALCRCSRTVYSCPTDFCAL